MFLNTHLHSVSILRVTPSSIRIGSYTTTFTSLPWTTMTFFGGLAGREFLHLGVSERRRLNVLV